MHNNSQETTANRTSHAYEWKATKNQIKTIHTHTKKHEIKVEIK